MNGKRAKRLKADEQIRIRRYAVEQITEKGARVEDVAAALGYGRSTVFWWMQKYSQGGIGELETKLPADPNSKKPGSDHNSRRKAVSGITKPPEPFQQAFQGPCLGQEGVPEA